MTITLASKPGITGASTLSIPKDWNSAWFRDFINNQLKGADVRNAVGASGISVSGNLTSPYATIGFKAPISLPAQVTITGTTPQNILNLTDGTVTSAYQTAVGTAYFGTLTNNSFQLMTNNIGRVSVASTGGVTINAPSAGATLLTNVASGQQFAIQDQAVGGSVPIGLDFWAGYASPTRGRLMIGDGTGWKFYVSKRSAGTTTDLVTFFDTGGVSIAAPSTAAAALTVQGNSASYTVSFQGAAVASASNGLLVLSGTNSSDSAVLVNNQANTRNYFQVRGDGSCFFFGQTNGTPALTFNSAYLTGKSPSMHFDTQFYNTGTATGTLSANKPGANNSVVAWIQVSVGGTTGWVPVFGN